MTELPKHIPGEEDPSVRKELQGAAARGIKKLREGYVPPKAKGGVWWNPGPKGPPNQCTDCSIDQPHPKAIQAEGVYCAGCGRTRPNAEYVLRAALPRNDGAPDLLTGAPGICFAIDGEWWHEPGSCPHCASPPGNNVGLLDEALAASGYLGRQLVHVGRKVDVSHVEITLKDTISLIERARAPKEKEPCGHPKLAPADADEAALSAQLKHYGVFHCNGDRVFLARQILAAGFTRRKRGYNAFATLSEPGPGETLQGEGDAPFVAFCPHCDESLLEVEVRRTPTCGSCWRPVDVFGAAPSDTKEGERLTAWDGQRLAAELDLLANAMEGEGDKIAWAVEALRLFAKKAAALPRNDGAPERVRELIKDLRCAVLYPEPFDEAVIIRAETFLASPPSNNVGLLDEALKVMRAAAGIINVAYGLDVSAITPSEQYAARIHGKLKSLIERARAP